MSRDDDADADTTEPLSPLMAYALRRRQELGSDLADRDWCGTAAMRDMRRIRYSGPDEDGIVTVRRPDGSVQQVRIGPDGEPLLDH